MSDALGPLMMDLEGLSVSEVERELLQHPLVGGLIFFTRNYENRAQIQDLVKAVRDVRQDILIAVDQEGGRVQRFRDGFSNLPALATFGELFDKNPAQACKEAESAAFTMASELVAVGIDISFAPVLDVESGISQVIGDRSFGHSADVVVELASAYIQGMNRAGMQATGKHFPGHGSVAADSHVAMPVDERDFATILAHDLPPFAKLSSRLGGIMPAHVIYSQVDELPAGFSRHWLQNILRQQLGFAGAIFSDDISMVAAAVAGDYVERTRLALDAGCDMVPICNTQAAVINVLDNLRLTPNVQSAARLAAMRAKS